MRKKPLGIIPVPESTVEHDFEIQSKYQDFTAEILRLSLLGISAVGYVALKYLFPEKDCGTGIPAAARFPFMLALGSLGLAAIASLMHRYVSVDSLSCHLQSVRKELRAEEGDAQSADVDREKRYLRFLISRYSVITAAATLGVGACALAYAFYILTQQNA